MFNKDLYYKKYLKYKNKYITLQSQIGGTTNRPPPLQRQNATIGLNPGGPQPPGGGPARAALPPENDDVHILPILPYRQNATRGLNPPVVTAPVAPPPENENVPISPPLLQRQNGTIGLNQGGPQPPGGGPAPAPPPENDDVPFLPILPYRQNATIGLNPPVVTAPVAPPPENENVPYRENATRGLNPHVVPPSVPHQNPVTSAPNTSEDYRLRLRPRPRPRPYRQNTTVVPPSVSHQNETSRVRARIPSVSFGYGQPDPTNVSAAPGYDLERRRRSENEE